MRLSIDPSPPRAEISTDQHTTVFKMIAVLWNPAWNVPCVQNLNTNETPLFQRKTTCSQKPSGHQLRTSRHTDAVKPNNHRRCQPLRNAAKPNPTLFEKCPLFFFVIFQSPPSPPSSTTRTHYQNHAKLSFSNSPTQKLHLRNAQIGLWRKHP